MIKESTKFFSSPQTARDFASAISDQDQYIILDTGKSGDKFFVKYRKSEELERR